ncbi:MAG TPA: serine/threonine-protein kinase [Kofleriaceae bacterium]|nr:serine/threonine-protein kinase [Kofleriaceae bacterium]
MGLLPAGTLLGRYEVIRLLSVGGMAEIYLARTEGIGGFEKRVVVKRMLPHFAIQPDYVRMFLAEARLAARLEHPNIVSVHDIGEETGNYHYAMEFVRGGDLRDLLRATARAGEMVPLGVAVGVALGVCAGLDHAHNVSDADGRPLEVVHRDVSLSNVLVSFEGAVKVTDFGVAKMDEADRRTRTGTLKGKVAYMSPEQCRGLSLDRRSDVFAIGILLYELITCRRLFAGSGELVTLQRIVRDDAPPPSRHRPTCPLALDEIVARALARDRSQRYQTAREMGRDLEALARTERLATSSSEIAAYVAHTMGVPAVSTRLGTETNTAFDSESSEHLADDDNAIISVEIVPYESAPVAAAPDVKPPPRKPTIAAVTGTSKWDLAIRVGSLALVALALVTVYFSRNTASPPPPRPNVGSFEPPPAESRPRPAESATAAPAPAVAMVRRAPTVEPERPEPFDSGTDSDIAVRSRGRDSDSGSSSRPRHRESDDRGARRERKAVRTASASSLYPPSDVDAAVAAAASNDLDRDAAVPPPTEPPPSSARAPADPPLPKPRPPPSGPDPAPVRVPDTNSQSPGSLDAVASLSRVEVKGPLQASELRRALERVLPSVRSCYRAAATRARRTPRLDIRISLQIDDARAARDVRAANVPLAGLSSCVADAIGRARTRVAPDVGNAQADVTVTFTPISP